jgi:hypothetical protein
MIVPYLRAAAFRPPTGLFPAVSLLLQILLASREGAALSDRASAWLELAASLKAELQRELE